MQLVSLAAMLEKWTPLLAAKALPLEITPNENALPAPSTVETLLTVDVNVLRALIGGDEAIMGEFLHDFRLSAARIGEQLRTAAAAGQASVAGALAHKLKSSARSVGALALGEVCAEIEQAGKVAEFESLALLLPRFEQELASVEAFLEAY